MRRREFITLLSGAAAAWPLPARAQQPDRVRRIGVLMGYPENDLEEPAFFAAFRGDLRSSGGVEGRNIRFDTRWATRERCRDKPVRERTDCATSRSHSFGVLPTTAAPFKTNAHYTNRFCQVSDPVGAGLVASLAQPGENVTGFAYGMA